VYVYEYENNDNDQKTNDTLTSGTSE